MSIAYEIEIIELCKQDSAHGEKTGEKPSRTSGAWRQSGEIDA
jgi:hypothetical protein